MALSSQRSKRVSTEALGSGARRCIDYLLLTILLVTAWVFVPHSPKFAANLQQDAVEFVVPAINLLENGRLLMVRYMHPSPPAHPIGLALLLAPFYAVLGHFPGNGIYCIALCLLGAVVGIYLIARKLVSPTCGLLAGLFF